MSLLWNYLNIPTVKPRLPKTCFLLNLFFKLPYRYLSDCTSIMSSGNCIRMTNVTEKDVKVVVAYFKVLSQQFPLGVEKHEIT